MKIEYRTGDILRSPIPFIIHSVNRQGKFGSGMAGAIRKAYPQAYHDYMAAFANGHRPRMGELIFSFSADNDSPYTFIHAVTQENYGYDGQRYVSYDALVDAFDSMSDFATKADIATIAMPALSSALAGGRWPIVSAIIEAHSSFQPVVYLLDGKIPE